MAIFLGNKEPQWPTPVTTSTMVPHFGSRQGEYNKTHFPGFATEGGSAPGGGITEPGAIEVTWASNVITNVAYKDATGAVQWTKATTDLLAAAEKIASLFMDATDNKLYFLTVSTGESPDQWALGHINTAGTIVNHTAVAGSGTSFDYSSGYMGAFYRTGGDGSGDFVFIHGKAVLSGAAAAPYRGAKMTFAVSDGAMTEAHLLPVAGGGMGYGINLPTWGPTSNNIIGGGTYSMGHYNVLAGPLFNTSTGNGGEIVRYPVNIGSPFHAYGVAHRYARSFRWRGHYAIGVDYQGGGGSLFTEASIHNMLDEMAVKHGFL
jgi:hypothetical protein